VEGGSLVTASQSLCIRGYQNGDEEQINLLFNLVFQSDRSLEEWRWKFQENPAGGSIITVAEEAGTIYGQYASLVIPFKFQDQTVLAAQPVDNLIHPDLRGGGKLQFSLFARQHSLAQENDIAFGFGFPNKVAYAVGKRLLRYQDLERLPNLFRRLSWRHTLRRRLPRLPRWLVEAVGSLSSRLYRLSLTDREKEGIIIKEVPVFDGRVNALWEEAKKTYGVLAVRDQQHLNWRYAAKPSDRYTLLIGEKVGILAGYIVLKVKQEREGVVGLIVDLLAMEDAAVEDALIRGALRRLSRMQVDYVHCWMLREDRLYQALERCGFQDHPAFPPVPVVFQVFSGGIDEGFLKDPRHWHLTLGDCDNV
jgi:hypothetical protein